MNTTIDNPGSSLFDRKADKSGTLDYLDAQVTELLGRIQQMEMWHEISKEGADPVFLRELMKQINLEIFSYQAEVIEANIAIIAQMPRSMNPRWVRSMLIHQAEEFSHGEMALRDYVALGGDEAYARSFRRSPASFAVCGMWWMIARMRDPFAYLGALYMFEGLTPIISGMAKPYLANVGIPKESMEFLEFHSTEDIKHTNLVRQMMRDVIGAYPQAAESIKYGFDCFLQVYPIPGWTAAYERAVRNYRGS